MDNNLDSITIELVVTACNMGEADIWMQGNLEIRLNGEKPYSESDIIDVDLLLKSIGEEGEHLIFLCCCGVPSCSGWVKGIQVIHLDESIKWTNLNNYQTWCFERNKIINDIDSIREEVKTYKKFFIEKGIDYVGVGHNW